MQEKFLYNFADINILADLKRIEGVGYADILGAKEYAMRVWLKPDKMLTYNVSTSEVLEALDQQNIEAAPGKVGESSDKKAQALQYVIKYTGKFNTKEQYENIPLRANENGEILRIKDIADVEFGTTYFDVEAKLNGKPAASIMLKQLPGSNASKVITKVKKRLEESDEEMLVFAINEIRTRYNSLSKEIFVPFEPDFEFENAKYVVPKIGDKKHLLDLCFKNAELYKKEREKQLAIIDPERHTDRIMQQMMKDLRMKEEPRRIEGFDNSNFQGDFAVSAMPVFIDGKPAKKEYRHFNVKTVVGPDDFATMEEVIFRRYSRVIEDKLPMPQ
jgi:excinuclease UvrABC nuclease subunit